MTCRPGSSCMKSTHMMSFSTFLISIQLLMFKDTSTSPSQPLEKSSPDWGEMRVFHKSNSQSVMDEGISAEPLFSSKSAFL